MKLLQELRFCWKVGAHLRDKLKLQWAAIAFHIYTRTRLKLSPAEINCSLLFGNRKVKVYLRPCGGDFLILLDVLLHDAYRLADFADAGAIRTVLDLGAHIGLTTLTLAHRYPRARFLCVEPDAGNLRLLRRNLESVKDRVTVVEGAAGAETGELFFDQPGESWGGQVNTAGKGRRVAAFSIEELIRRFGVDELDILKADIEGAERAAFHDAHRSGWPRKTKFVVAEYHEGYSGPDLIRDLGEEFWLAEPEFGYGNVLFTAVNKLFYPRPAATGRQIDSVAAARLSNG